MSGNLAHVCVRAQDKDRKGKGEARTPHFP